MLEIHDLQECPVCGGPGLLEEENGWCWYAVCADCGSHTAQVAYRSAEDRTEAAAKAAYLWNMGKVLRSGAGE